jgi:o-succinylbenzoate synthase
MGAEMGAEMGDARHTLDATVAALRARVAAAAPDAIVSAEVVEVEIPLCAPVPTASGAWTRRASLLVLLRDAGGAVGVGEVALPPADALGASVAWASSPASGCERLAARMLGATPAWGLDLLDRLQSSGAPGAPGGSGGAGSSGSPGATDLARATVAGFEAALLDLAARRSGTVVAALLHSALAGASLPVAEPRSAVAVSALIAAPDPQVAAREARRAVDAGHACVKLQVGDEPDDAALAMRVAAVRSALGPGRELRLDANAAWTLPVAMARLTAVAPFDVAYVEQPVASVADLAALRSRSGVRVAADESITGAVAAAEVLGLEAADVLVVKPSRVGGLAETLAIAALAHRRGIPVVLSTFLETGVGLAAALHVAAVLPGPEVAHGLATGDLLETDLLVEPLEARRGRLALPGAPGLGVDLDAAAVERHRVGVTAAGSSADHGGSRRGGGPAHGVGPPHGGARPARGQA